jgi:hypothetical protein
VVFASTNKHQGSKISLLQQMRISVSSDDWLQLFENDQSQIKNDKEKRNTKCLILHPNNSWTRMRL